MKKFLSSAIFATALLGAAGAASAATRVHHNPVSRVQQSEVDPMSADGERFIPARETPSERSLFDMTTSRQEYQ